jgi:hypothetical protein
MRETLYAMYERLAEEFRPKEGEPPHLTWEEWKIHPRARLPGRINRLVKRLALRRFRG